jgi:hypothetical protein
VITWAFIDWQPPDTFPLFWPLLGGLIVVAFFAWRRTK